MGPAFSNSVWVRTLLSKSLTAFGLLVSLDHVSALVRRKCSRLPARCSLLRGCIYMGNFLRWSTSQTTRSVCFWILGYCHIFVANLVVLFVLFGTVMEFKFGPSMCLDIQLYFLGTNWIYPCVAGRGIDIDISLIWLDGRL